MRYLKSHRVPFNGLAWNHWFRDRWRKLGNFDPIVSTHPASFAFREIQFPLLIWTAAWVIGCILQTTVSLMESAGWLLGTAIWMYGAMIGFAVWFSERSGCKKAAKKFTVAVNELAEALGESPETLSQFSLRRFQLGAESTLLDRAKEVWALEVEPAWRWDSSRKKEHQEREDKFKAAYAFFLECGLVEDNGYGPYYREASRR